MRRDFQTFICLFRFRLAFTNYPAQVVSVVTLVGDGELATGSTFHKFSRHLDVVDLSLCNFKINGVSAGVSRSGITMSAAFMRGIDRKEAGAFSFLLSIPVIFGGVIFEIPEIKHGLQAGQQSWAILFTGVVTSFVIGFLTIHYFVKLIARIHLGWFTTYRLTLATILVLMLWN